MIFRDAIRAVDTRRPFADRAEEGGEVHFLKPFALTHFAIDVADEQDHRLRILMRDMHADAGVRRAGTAGDESDAGPLRHRAVRTCHHRHAAFLPARHQIDRVLLAQSIEHLKEAFARHGENPLAALFDQAVDEELGGGGRRARCHGPCG